MTKEDIVYPLGIVFILLTLAGACLGPFGVMPPLLMAAWGVSFILFMTALAVTMP